MDLDSRYEMLEKIGAGSFATCYRARDLELGREVAIKQIHDQYLADPEQLDRYWQEAQLLASLQHPNIVTIFDIYRERGWLILELMQTNLADRMSGRQMDLRALRTTLAHSLRALKYLHSRGVVHGDVKLSNLMIDARRRVKIGDFGLARRVSDEEGSLLKGTTKYMAPEVVSEEFGEIGPASDLYSLGFCAYELLCGENFENLFPGLSAFGRNKQIAWMMWHAAPDRRLPPIHKVLEGVPQDLTTVIEKLVEKDQQRRYQSADEALSTLKVDLKLVKSEDQAEVSDAHDDEDDAADDEQRKRLWLAGGAFAASFLLCLVMLFWPGGGSDAPAEPKNQVWLVSEVFEDSQSVKVEDLDHEFARKLSLGETPRIFLTNTGRNIILEELQPGDRIEVEETVDDSGQKVMRVRASRPVSNQGRLQHIDQQDRRILVAIDEGGHRETLNLRVPERASIKLNETGIRLRDLKEGDRVQLHHLPEVGEKTGRVVDRLTARRLRDQVGFVANIDADRRRLTINLGKGSTASSLTLPLAENCNITLGDNAIPLNELRRGDQIRFSYDIEFLEVDVMARDKVRASGTVTAVDPARRQLTLQQSGGKTLRLHVPEELDQSDRITLSLEPARLADLREYDVIEELTYEEVEVGSPLAHTVFARRPVKSDRWVIVINPDTSGDPFLRPLPYSLNDANEFKQAMLKRYAVSEDRLLLLRDQIRTQMQFEISNLLADVRSQTQLIVYVTGHAYVADDQAVYLAVKGFNWDLIADTGLSLDWLAERLEGCASNDKLLLFEASHADEGPDRERQPSSAEMLAKLKTPLETTWAIASCAKGQRGQASEEIQGALFSHYLTEAFRGSADRDRDLHLTAEELFPFLKEKMAGAPLPGGVEQTPVLLPPKSGPEN